MYPIGSMYAIYGNIYHRYTPNVSIYTIYTWILWVIYCLQKNIAHMIFFFLSCWEIHQKIWPNLWPLNGKIIYNVGPPFENAKLVNISPMSLWFMIRK